MKMDATVIVKRDEIPLRHGDTFNQGKHGTTGHFTASNGDIVLLVTERNGTYQEHAQGWTRRMRSDSPDQGNWYVYRWISQNSTTPESKKGKALQVSENIHIYSRETKRQHNCKFEYQGKFKLDSFEQVTRNTVNSNGQPKTYHPMYCRLVRA